MWAVSGWRGFRLISDFLIFVKTLHASPFRLLETLNPKPFRLLAHLSYFAPAQLGMPGPLSAKPARKLWRLPSIRGAVARMPNGVSNLMMAETKEAWLSVAKDDIPVALFELCWHKFI